MNPNKITVFRYTMNKFNLEEPLKLIVILKTRINNIITTIKENIEGTGDRFTKIMMRLSIIKLALAMIALIVMTVLLFMHLDAFEPITIQFSKWVSSPLICFIILVIVAKVVGLGIGLTLTIMSIKDLTFAGLELELRKHCKRSFHICAKRFRCSDARNQRKSPVREIGGSTSIRQTVAVSK